MSYQVGDTLHLTASVGGLPAGEPVTYIWEFPWDNSVAATTVPTYAKVLNKGGDPADGQLLYFTVTAALADGQHVTQTQSVAVNWPPMIVPSPVVTHNDEVFPYDTQIQLTAWDVEQGGALAFHYTLNGTDLGPGIETASGVFSGTYDGTVMNASGTTSVFARTVQSNQTIRAHVIDDQSGTRAIDFTLVGREPAAPVIGFSAGPSVATVDEATRPNLRIGPNQTASFAVYADASGAPYEFLWTFAGSNGWAATSYSAGTTATVPSGSIRNETLKALEGETAGDKRVLITVLSTSSGRSTQEVIGVTLIANSVATTATIQAFRASGAYLGNEMSGDDVQIATGARAKYTASVDDPQGDLVHYRWAFIQPSPVSPTTLYLYGAEVVIDLTDYPVASTVQGTLRTTDRLGSVASFTITPILTVTAA